MNHFQKIGHVVELWYSRNAFPGEHGRWVAKFSCVIPGLPIGFHNPNTGKEGVAVASITTKELRAKDDRAARRGEGREAAPVGQQSTR